MNAQKFSTLDEALKDAEKHKLPKGLLLGNGFSQECCLANEIQNVFNYSSLLGVISDEKISDAHTVGELFQHLGTCDFEHVLHQLNVARTNQGIIDLFLDNDSKVQEIINHQIKSIRLGLANSISKIHPKHQYDKISNESYNACAKFIKKFEYIFTMNYDLLLYWAQMNDNELKSMLVDGFWNVINEKNYWDIKMQDNLFHYAKCIYYLHGALHLFTDSKDETDQLPYKIKKSKDNWLIHDIKEQISNGSMPLCVTEETAGYKMDRIYKNHYLTHCYQELLEKEGAIFTFGVSFKHDEHIINALKSNKKIIKIYVGILDNDTQPLAKAQNVLGKSKSIVSYNSSHSHPWGKRSCCADDNK